MSRVRTLIVVPCYNEADRLDPPRFVQFARAHPDIGFIFVDDGSTDGTNAILKAIAAEIPGQTAVSRLPQNSGKAEAVRRGVCQAFTLEPDHVGYWDADLATPLSEIAAFTALLDDHPHLQLVMGARVQLLGRRVQRNATRHYFGRAFATAVAIVLGFSVYDTQCGAKVMRGSALSRGLFERSFLTRWLFDVELLARLKHASSARGGWDPSTAVYEYPLTQWTDVAGSKVRVSDFARAAIQLAHIARSYPRSSPARADYGALTEDSGQSSETPVA